MQRESTGKKWKTLGRSKGEVTSRDKARRCADSSIMNKAEHFYKIFFSVLTEVGFNHA